MAGADELRAEDIAQTQSTAPSPTRVGDLPSHFGRYRIQKVLGRGGMGAVYLAHDTELERKVAIKVPHLSANPATSAGERFLREARAAATLSHPNICPVYDVNTRDGIPYLTMAFIEGRPLSDLVKTGPLPLRQAVQTVRQLALGLAEAHQKGIIHRDLKPANVMVNARGEPVLMDFGLARQIKPDEAAPLTQDGQMLGTPAYMSPEQVKGDLTAIGPGCDIYSLGVILYEVLTGSRPFPGTIGEVLAQVLREEPPAPSALRPEVSSALDALCKKAMAKQPHDRFASMTDFVAALDSYLRLDISTSVSHQASTIKPQHVPPPRSPDLSLTPKLPPTVQRRPPRWPLALLVFLTLMGAAAGGAYFVLPKVLSEPTHQVAVTPTGLTSVASSTPASAIAEQERRFLGTRDGLTAIRDHLRATRPDDRKHQRYFSLVTLHNQKALKDTDLRTARAALSGLLNGLSRKPNVVPKAIDKEQTLFVVDVRQLGWDEGNPWREMLKVYPYGLKYDHSTDNAVQDLAKDAYQMAGTDQPCIRGDWFIATASRPPLYHALGGARDHPVKDFGAPVAIVARRYLENELTADDAARELGLADGQTLRTAIQVSDQLRRMGLGPMATGGTVSRGTWESLDQFNSPFQEAALALDLGTPVRVR